MPKWFSLILVAPLFLCGTAFAQNADSADQKLKETIERTLKERQMNDRTGMLLDTQGHITDQAASNREYIAVLSQFVGLEGESPCENFPAVHDVARGGASAVLILYRELQPPLTDTEKNAAKAAVTELEREGWNTWCQAYATQMDLAKLMVVHMALERGFGPAKHQ
jgi:hypothetical protein